ncbi:MAG: DUF2029 domain-containing protein, partial [Nitrososphaera sp.]|nr:DUF2029 domain-containing protein [Nitrososphaera sp.]
MTATSIKARYRELIAPDKRYLTIIAAFSVFLFVSYSFRYSTFLTHGFAAYYAYAKLLLDGEFTPDVFDYKYFNQKLTEFGFSRVQDAPNNIPTNAFALAALAVFQPVTAKFIWTLLSLALYAASIRKLLRIYEIPTLSHLGLALIALSCLWRPSYENMAYGQLYIALLFLYSLSLQGFSQRKDYSAAWPIGLMVFIKGYGLLNAAWLLLSKRYKGWIVFTTAFMSLVFASLPFLGQEVWSAYYENVFLKLISTIVGNTAYQTLSSLFAHLLHSDPAPPSSSLLALPLNSVQMITFIVQTALIVFVLYCGKKAGSAHHTLTYSALLATA